MNIMLPLTLQFIAMPLLPFQKVPLNRSNVEGYECNGYIFNPRNDRPDENNNAKLSGVKRTVTVTTVDGARTFATADNS